MTTRRPLRGPLFFLPAVGAHSGVRNTGTRGYPRESSANHTGRAKDVLPELPAQSTAVHLHAVRGIAELEFSGSVGIEGVVRANLSLRGGTQDLVG